MKRTVIGIIAFLALAAVLYAAWWRIASDSIAGKTDYFMAQYLTDYLSEHDLVAPPTWPEFLAWCHCSGNDAFLPPLEQLEKYFTLPDGKIDLDSRQIVVAKVKKMKKHAKQMNEDVDWDRLKEVKESNNELKATGEPAPQE